MKQANALPQLHNSFSVFSSFFFYRIDYNEVERKKINVVIDQQ